jgi:hypothetical protein
MAMKEGASSKRPASELNGAKKSRNSDTSSANQTVSRSSEQNSLESIMGKIIPNSLMGHHSVLRREMAKTVKKASNTKKRLITDDDDMNRNGECVNDN